MRGRIWASTTVDKALNGTMWRRLGNITAWDGPLAKLLGLRAVVAKLSTSMENKTGCLFFRFKGLFASSGPKAALVLLSRVFGRSVQHLRWGRGERTGGGGVERMGTGGGKSRGDGDGTGAGTGRERERGRTGILGSGLMRRRRRFGSNSPEQAKRLETFMARAQFHEGVQIDVNKRKNAQKTSCHEARWNRRKFRHFE